LDDIYSAGFVRTLFNEMSKSYERVNYISSFGFSERWRRECIDHAAPVEGLTVLDLMTGMGESWPHLLPVLGTTGTLHAVDFSPGMLEHARVRREQFPKYAVHLKEEDALSTSIHDGSADRVYSLFGLKTLDKAQTRRLAQEIQRVLKPSGRFTLIEVSIPRNSILRFFYKLYLKVGIPLIGRIFLGNANNYRMLGIYTERFGNCTTVVNVFREVGLDTHYHEYFFGCATGVSGAKLSAG
jgi:ubiquinone/menaquinone biosynthesis methyltransferase